MSDGRGWHVRCDPEIYVDLNIWEACSREAVFAYIASLFYLAEHHGPDGIYPHDAVRHTFGDGAAVVTGQLVRFGLWAPEKTGCRVRPYLGWRLTPDKRVAIPMRIRRQVYERDGNRCITCGTTENLSLDHVFPWSLGGPDTIENLRTLCRSCNSSKGARI